MLSDARQSLRELFERVMLRAVMFRAEDRGTNAPLPEDISEVCRDCDAPPFR